MAYFYTSRCHTPSSLVTRAVAHCFACRGKACESAAIIGQQASFGETGCRLLGEEVEILKPLLYCGQRGRLLQREEMCHGDFSDRWLVLVDTEQESLILSLAAIEFRVCRET